jgi:FkbM family methyltransferase
MSGKLFKYMERAIKIIHVLGLYEGLLYIIKAKMLKSKTADAILRIALHGEKVVKINRDTYMWRGKKFYVPAELATGFLSAALAEIIADKNYVLEGSYDVIVDIGGFLGETAWWFITEGYARRVIVFEPVYYDLCRSNVGDVAEVRSQAVHWSKGVAVFEVRGAESRITLGGEKVAETVTLAEILSSLTGRVAVKMDCEGCEESILDTPCDILRRAEEYIIEIHPLVSMESIVRYMESCGFKVSPRKVHSSKLAIYHFRRRH